MKNVMIYVMSILMVLSMAACGGKADSKQTEATEAIVIGGDPATWGPVENTEDANTQIPNPWQECETLEEAGKLAGFDFNAPDTLEGFDDKYIAAIPEDIAQVIFSKTEDENAQVTFRKGTGDQEDISGDYNSYDDVDTLELDGKTVTIKSNNGLVYTAIWNQDGFSYAISARAGVSMEQMTQWIQALA